MTCGSAFAIDPSVTRWRQTARYRSSDGLLVPVAVRRDHDLRQALDDLQRELRVVAHEPLQAFALDDEKLHGADGDGRGRTWRFEEERHLAEQLALVQGGHRVHG